MPLKKLLYTIPPTKAKKYSLSHKGKSSSLVTKATSSKLPSLTSTVQNKFPPPPPSALHQHGRLATLTSRILSLFQLSCFILCYPIQSYPVHPTKSHDRH